MSSGQTPRTPEYFPRMNDRAGRRPIRRAKDPEERIWLLWNRCRRTLVKAMEQDVTDLALALRSRRFAEGGEVKGGPVHDSYPDEDSIPAMLLPGYHSLDGGQTWHADATTVSADEQQHQADMRARSHRLAIERGHMRRN